MGYTSENIYPNECLYLLEHIMLLISEIGGEG